MNKTALYFKTCLVDTGKEWNEMTEAYQNLHFELCIKGLDSPKLCTPTKESIKLKGIILLIVKMGTIQAHTRFGNVKELFVDISLGTEYIDHAIKGVFPIDKKLLPIHSAPIQIFGQRERPAQSFKLIIAQVVYLQIIWSSNDSSRKTISDLVRNEIYSCCSHVLQWTHDHRPNSEGQTAKQMASCTWNIQNWRNCTHPDIARQPLKNACTIL